MKKRNPKLNVIKTCSLIPLLISPLYGQLTLLVDFRGDGATTNSTSADFAVADSAVDLSAPVNQFTGGTRENAVTGVGTNATLDFFGGSFSQNGGGPRDNQPILDGYIFVNASSAGPDDPVATITGLTGISAGDAVTITAYAIGDRNDQVGPVVLDLGDGNVLTSPVTSPANPFVTFQFTAPVGFNSFELSVNNNPGGDNASNFAALNGFSLTVGESNENPIQLADQLTAYWPFENNLEDQAGEIFGSANTNDDDLDFRGTGSGFGAGLFGSAGYSGNGGGYAEAPDSADIDESNNVISISAWMLIDEFDTGFQTLISKGEGSNYRIARWQQTNTVGYAGGVGDIFDTSEDVNDDEWHHVVATSGPSGTRLYIDGLLTSSSNNTVNLTNSNNPLFIGNNPDADNRQWNGQIDDLALWHRVLNADEVALIYNAGINEQSLNSLLAPAADADADNDGLPDIWEFAFGLSFDPVTGALGDNGASGDPDGDLLSNLDEFTNGTSPIVADTDGDGVSDSSEVNTHGSDPTIADTDGDGSSDGEEIFFGTDPNNEQEFPAADQTLAGVETVGGVGPYLDGALPIINPSSGPINENWATEVAFPNLNFSQLKGLVSEPRSTNLHIIERRGAIQRVDASNPNTNTQTEVLDIASRIVNGDNGGLRSVVFHPDYNLPGSPNRNHIYAFYSTTAEFAHGFTSDDGDFFYRVSRFTRNEATGTFPSSSELVLIQQHSRDEGQHFGGSLGFDQDGFLLIAWGDMEFSDSRVGVDFYQDVQRVDRIFQGAVLRIDVDNQGGSISQPPTRTLQGSTGPNAVAGTSQSCLPDHNYFHVDNFSGRSYMIPSDNYFLLNPPAAGSASFPNTPTHGPALDEHQGLGTRNPWRMAVDPVDGDVALFIVGSNSGNGSDFETVDLLSPGANWEWPYLEGSQSQTSETGRSRPPSQYAPIALGKETAPLAYWGKNFGRVASGGLFYRGSQWPSIDQQLIFADQNSGRIWALDYKSAGAPSENFTLTDGVSTPSNYSVRLLLNSSVGIRQMTAGPTGEEIYMVDGNRVFRLFNASAPNPEPPALLSQTGAFTNLATMTPREGLIPFEPASELWSDRAAKLRWIAVPNTAGIDGEYDLADEQITYSEDGSWAYPIGTVFIKHFALPSDLRNPEDPASLVPLETRFSVRGANGTYFFFTYRWRADGSDADLINDAESAPFDITNLDGSPGTQVWEYPSRAQCFECHQSNAGSVLGMKSRQLNHPLTYPSTGITANQLTTFASLGIFDEGPDFETLDTLLTSVSIDDSSQGLEARVRSYLDSNCSFCHQPGSEAGRASFDALLNTPLSLTGIINGETEAGDLGATDAHIVTPGSPESSVLYLRDSSLNPNFRMPPVGRTLNDPDYLLILEAWIETFGRAEFIAWAQERGIESGFLGDSDEDGFANVFEFVFRQGDADVDLSTLPQLIIAGENNPSIRIPVSGDALTDGFEVTVEDSDNLVDWHTLGDPLSELEIVNDNSAPGTDGILEVRFNGSSPKRFLRYGVLVP